MAQKWYQKATVQVAIVNAIPTLSAAIIGTIGLLLTYFFSKEQIKLFETEIQQSSFIYDQQKKKDSIQNADHLNLAILQLRLNKKEIELVEKQSKHDSIALSILEYQNSILVKERKFEAFKNAARLVEIREKFQESFFSIYEIVNKDSSICKTVLLKDTISNVILDQVICDYNKIPNATLNTWARKVLNAVEEGLANPTMYENKRLRERWELVRNDMKFICMQTEAGFRMDFGIYNWKIYFPHFMQAQSELILYLKKFRL